MEQDHTTTQLYFLPFKAKFFQCKLKTFMRNTAIIVLVIRRIFLGLDFVPLVQFRFQNSYPEAIFGALYEVLI